MVARFGLWPGVVAFANDADLWCVACACQRYGQEAVAAVIEERPAAERSTDHEGNPLHAVLYGAEDLHGAYCGGCLAPLCDEGGSCYRGGVAGKDELDADGA